MLHKLVKAYGMLLARRALPEPGGVRHLSGLREGVEVVRDEFGIPHIRARSARDLFFAQGYVQAEDRLWQLEFYRRTAAGRLAELFGDGPVAWEDLGIPWRGRRISELDRYLRIIGMRRAAEAALAVAGGEAREAFDAFAAGVNAFVANLSPRRLPVEMQLLGAEFEPWSPLDSAAMSKLMALEISYALKHKLALVAIAEKLADDPDRLREILPPDYPPDAPRLAAGWHGAGDRAARVLAGDQQFRPFVGWSGARLGSNWCLLGGARTTTGKPLLVNDPHLQLTAPGFFHPCHLTGGPYDVAGVSIPGTPGVTIGRNRAIAWGFTNVMADDADLYLETPHPNDPFRYRMEVAPEGGAAAGGPGDVSGSAQYTRFDTIDAPIRVKGERFARPCTIRVSRHGPILSDAFLTREATLAGGAGCEFARGPLLALRWTAHHPSSEVDAVLGLNRARRWPEAVEALRSWGAPAQNVCYADSAGNIGYYAAGRFPIRANRKNILPADGARGEGEWLGFVPFEENPHCYNPTAGYLASANNKIVDDDYPYYISDFFASPYRVRRIHEIVRQKGKLSPADGERLMLDVYSLQAKEIIEAIVRPLEDRLKESKGEIEVAVNYLLNWDFQCTRDSIAASVFHVFYDECVTEVFGSVLGGEVFSQFLDGWVGGEHADALEAALKNPDSAWFRGRSRDEAVRAALARAVTRLKRTCGEATQAWEWGKLHKMTLRHAFHSRPLLRKLFDIGPVPSPGGTSTLDNSQWHAAHVFARVTGAGVRRVEDLADLEGGSRLALAGGVSGNPASAHHADLFKLWLEGRTVPVPIERAPVERAARERLALEPG